MNYDELIKVIDDSTNDVISFFRSILRFNTVNPPGNELPLAQYIYDFLSRENIDCEIIESDEGRGNVIAHLKGQYSSKRLLYLSHLDVVPVGDINLWTHHPFSADIEEGWIYGRGALDCKSLVAAEVFSLIFLKRLGIKPKFDLILATTADEEVGGWKGIGWIASKFPEKVKADYVINEGGGLPIRSKGGKIVYLVDVCEKGYCNVKIKVTGKSGHSSVPYTSENALYLMSLIIKRLYEYEPPMYRLEIVEESFKKIFGHIAGAPGRVIAYMLFSPLKGLALKILLSFEPRIIRFLKSLMGLTIAPTIAKSGDKENVIPSSAEIIVNCRLLPGQDDKYVESIFKEVLKDFKGIDINISGWFPASFSNVDSTFFNVMESTLKILLPNYNVSIAPFVMPGSSDSRFLRNLGAKVYGFSPLNPKLNYSELMNLAHGINEKIDIQSLILSTKFLTLLPTKLSL
ncbi:MAG: M20/M25/M40 family metallo-hydrolase [Candidatus Methanomethylicia archaeon]|nr:M20/M25/M40 family metallo-hydrolase [Candidatus Methanomethylicia archaeon]